MKHFLTILTALFIWSCNPTPNTGSEQQPRTEVAEPIYMTVLNDSDLSGWVVPDDNIWFTVQDGILHLENGPDQKGQTLETERTYRDFIIECDFKFGRGTVDSGIFIRNDDQIQIGESGSLKRDLTASPFIPGKGYPVEADVASTLKMKDWNTLRVKAVGPVYTAWLNGTEVMNYTSDTAVQEGPVGLQLHGNRDMTIDFRNIRIAEL